MPKERDVPQTPFELMDSPGSDCCHIKDGNGEEFAWVDSTTTFSAQDGAEFILRACNSHNALLSACQNLVAGAHYNSEDDYWSIGSLTAIFDAIEKATRQQTGVNDATSRTATTPQADSSATEEETQEERN
jgi:hypothetical protein